MGRETPKHLSDNYTNIGGQTPRFDHVTRKQKKKVSKRKRDRKEENGKGEKKE